jgi:uncharacterized protein YbjT (DUF2867 family)
MAKKVLLTGATGFIGNRVFPALEAAGFDVYCATRNAEEQAAKHPDRNWVQLDAQDRHSVANALRGMDAVLYLIHSMGEQGDFEAKERRAAENLVYAAEDAGVQRIVYLGGVAPEGKPSKHLRSRMATGERLRSGKVPAVELRAGMIVGAGSASWCLVRDLSARLPFMILPSWLQNRSQPVAIDDVVFALVRALELGPEVQGVFDLPGPETLSGEQVLRRIAGLLGIKPLTLRVPFITPKLSSYWLKLVTRADFSVAQELVEGLTSDLLARHEHFWTFMPEHRPTPFDDAAKKALAEEDPKLGIGTRAVEWSLQHLAQKA